MTVATRRLAAAVLTSAVLVLAAPWIGTIRAWIQSTFPGRFGVIVNALVAGAIVLAAAGAAIRIRANRSARYFAIAAALGLAIGSAAMTASPSASQNAVERFHFVSFGLITFLFYRAVQDDAGEADLSLFGVPVMAALLVAIVDEWFQWFVPGRYGEVRDIFLNFAAIASGLLCSLGISPPIRLWPRLRSSSQRVLAATASGVVLALAMFIHAVHLGHAIVDPQIGTFRSRYTEAQLKSLAVDRQSEWRAMPPPAQPPRMAREDQYLAEGVWHIMARNAAWENDLRTSWLENQILERYFSPVLDHPSYAAGVSRWPEAQRRDAEKRVGSADRVSPFVSAAERHPIWTWSPLACWSIALGVAAVLVALARPRSIVRR